MIRSIGIGLFLASSVSAQDGFRGQAVAVQSANTCRGSQVEWGLCPIRPGCESCEPVDCALGQWSPFSSCDCSGLKSRSRVVVQDKNECGAPCQGVLSETAKCKVVHCREEKDCRFSPWGKWGAESTADDESPGVGATNQCVDFQMKRKRTIEQLPKNGGKSCRGPLEQTVPCGKPPGPIQPLDCQLSQWHPWGSCSASCGTGRRTRQRSILHEAKNGGTPCESDLTVTEECGNTDGNGDPSGCPDDEPCIWDTWAEWSACSCTCGGGQKRRERQILQSPKGNGQLCEARTKKEISPCNTQSCGVGDRDGQWSSWQEWGKCSQPCDGGVQKRRRVIQVHPRGAGKPAEGSEEEYRSCNMEQCHGDVDCMFDNWGHWSSCSCSCNGVKHRSRTIRHFGAGRHGKSCTGAVHEIAPCNNGDNMPAACGEETADCVLAPWTNWDECSVTCGSGERSRTREVARHAVGSGKPCTGIVSELKRCHKKPCVACTKCGTKVLDCKWGQWEKWGHCDTCTGQKRRVRMIAKMPENGGRPCDARPSEELKPCLYGQARQCGDQYWCVWTGWSNWNADTCPTGCTDKGVQKRSRGLHVSKMRPAGGAIFVSVAKKGACSSATQHEEEMCPMAKECFGMKENSIDCKPGPWSPWASCDCTGLRSRQRSIDQSNNEHGEPCKLTLSETRKCRPTCRKPPRDCVLGSWSAWKTDEDEVEVMEEEPEPQLATPDQIFDALDRDQNMFLSRTELRRVGLDGSAADWNATCEDMQWDAKKGPTRSGLNDYLDTLSNEELEEIRQKFATQQAPAKPQICQKNPSGQKYRTREALREASRGGVPCSGVLRETIPCGGNSDNPEPVECKLSDWSMWTRCSVTCGAGTKMRTRQIVRQSAHGGNPCRGDLVETDDCSAGDDCHSGQECVWGQWHAWSPCTCKCGGGQKRRSRQIEKYPSGNAPMCPEKPSSEIAACNTQSCEGACVDGKWGAWTEWTACSRSCNGGLRWRSRDVDTMASSCGEPVRGKASQFDVCNDDVPCEQDQDCLFSAWGHWSDCSCTCNGVKHRSRSIRQYGKGKNGKFCEGPVHEITACNSGDSLPDGCTDAAGDCKLSHWSHWSECSATCGTGQKRRSRKIAQEAYGGGEACPDSALTEMAECNARRKCHEAPVVDCQWSSWGEWGHCDKCGGQKRRFRYITQMPENGGSPCGDVEVVAEEVEACKRQCHEPIYCTWSEWGQWGACPHTCNPHTRKRERHLVVTHDEPEDSVGKFQSLKVTNESLQQWTSTVNALVVFSCATSLILVFIVLKLRKEVTSASNGMYVSATADAAPSEEVEMSGEFSQRPLLASI